MYGIYNLQYNLAKVMNNLNSQPVYKKLNDFD